MLSIDQIRDVNIHGTKAFLICGKIVNLDGTYKNSRGGVRATKDTAKQVPLFEMENLDGLVNIYSDIQKILEVCKNLKLPTHQEKRFFTTINGNACRFEHFLKRAVVSSNQIRKVMQEAVAANIGTGLGYHDNIFMHSLRGTSTQVLNNAVFSKHIDSKTHRAPLPEVLKDYIII